MVILDLSKMVSDLVRAGITQAEIGEHIGVQQPTVSRYQAGSLKTCSYHIGAALVELHRKRAYKRRST